MAHAGPHAKPDRASVSWLGVRAMFETSVDAGDTSTRDAFGAASISGWFGPVLRF
jgi:hypothetical protein